MFPRILTWTLRSHASVRSYSTLGGPSGSSGFLSDLMKRIDTINMKTEKIAQNQTQSAGFQQKRTSGSQKTQKKAFSPSKSINATARAPAKAKIAIKDHPLSSNMFKLMDEKNFLGMSRQGPRQGPRQGARKGQFQGAKTDGNAQTRPQQRTQTFGDRKPGARRVGGNKRTPFNQKRGRTARPASIVPKKLQSAALKPAVTGDVFLYGKPAKLGVSTSSRVAAVTKECLLKSQYPYKLPKSIIDGMDEGFSGNKFLLQKDYDLTVDPEHFQDRIKKVVRGETEELVVSKKASLAEQDTHRGLVANGSLNMENKQTIYDMVTGLKSAQDLLKNAAWNK